MNNWSRWALISVVAAMLAVAGCGSEDPGTTDNDDDQANQGWNVDAGGGNMDPGDDVGDGGDDPDAGGGDDDAGDGDNDDDPVDAPDAIDDFLICESDADCPINGSSCIEHIEYNRTDADGTYQVPVAEVFDEVDTGDGLCTRNCAQDPTVCDTVEWAGSGGQAVESSCFIATTGDNPYEVISQDPFEVNVDFDEAEQGQAFGAICLPPLDHADDRSDTFCSSCDVPQDCDDDSVCYNTLVEDYRQTADELGDSFCVESCDEASDCPIGFDCRAMGQPSPDGDDDNGDGDNGDGGDDSAPTYCLPVEDSCTDCVDRDENGYGTGNCGPEDERQTPFDCDDTNPDAYYDPDDMDHPFPDHCYDDPEEQRFYSDLNCSGVLDHEEQIGADVYGEQHCTACEDDCSGQVPDGYRQCKVDDDGQPYCGVGCQTGYATCSGDPADGCPINIDDEKSLGDDQLYRDEESPWIWYDADDGEQWANNDAQPHFFCSQQEAEASLNNPVQRRGCHDPGDDEAHPGRTQTCNPVDENCSGQIGGVDPDTQGTVGGQTYQLGDDCQVPGEQGVCQEGTAVCDGTSMECESNTSAVNTPVCSDSDTTCDGSPDSDGDEFTVSAGDDLILVDDDGEPKPSSPATVNVGDPCQIDDDDIQGRCSIGEVRCGGDDGLYCEQVNFPEPEKPGFSDEDRSCDGTPRHLNDNGDPHVIYVDSGDSGPDLTEALDLAKNCDLNLNGENVPCDVFVEDSSNLFTYGTVVLEEGVHVYGGFDTSTWDLSSTSTFEEPDLSTGSSVEVRFDSSPSTAIGMRGSGIDEETHFHGIDIETEDVDGCSANIGAYCDDCDGLDLKQVTITAGKAGDGADGGDGSDGGNAADPGDSDGPDTMTDTSYTDGSWGHIQGGDGGQSLGRFWGGSAGWSQDDDGSQGQPTGTSHGGDGGTSGSPQGEQGGHGQAVSPADTPDGHTVSQNWHISVDCPYNFRPSLPDTAHGGGGGGSYGVCHYNGLTGYYECAAAAGSGGGAAGRPGYSGESGAPSIGMVLNDTDAESGDGIQMESVTINAGNGGAGGAGGDGGDGGSGGETNIVQAGFAFAIGGAGGDGAGGPGGPGGHGGPSIGLLRINSPKGTYLDFNASGSGGGPAGSGGIGGMAPMDADGDRHADNGPAGPAGSQGGSCNEFRLSWPYQLPTDIESSSDCL